MRRFVTALALVVAAPLPAAADTVLTLRNHSDEVVMMGQKTPAQDNEFRYWFSDDSTRYDMGDDTSIIMSLEAKKLYVVNHLEKNFSAIDLPFDFKSLVGPEMAPMMEQMMKMMAASVTVTPTERTGEFGGYACKYSKVDISMAMMQMNMDQCLSEKMPIDYARYQALAKAQAEMVPNGSWMKELAEKLKGFPVRSETTTTVMGKSFQSWQELKSVEEKSAPAGFYAPPAGYMEVKFDPMAQQQPKKKRK
jgi:hypothetical protein